MGRIFISPPSYCMRQVSPLERLIAGLTDGLPVGHLSYFTPDVCRQHCDATRRRPWVSTVNVGEYSPEEISVKVESGAVVVHARREVKEGDNFNITERRRVVKLPETVDKKHVSCFLGGDGTLSIQAPFVENKLERTLEVNHETTKPRETGMSPAPVGDSESKLAEQVPVTSEKNFTETVTKKTDSFEATALKRQESSSKSEEDDLPSITSLEGTSSKTNSSEIQTGENASKNVEKDTPTLGDRTDFEVETINSVANQGDCQDIKPFEDSIRRTDDGLNKRFEVSLNMKGFEPENVSVRFVDNELCIDAKQETRKDGLYSVREFHRKFKVPDNSILECARANVNSSGVVNVIIPLRASSVEGISVPIVNLSE